TDTTPQFPPDAYSVAPASATAPHHSGSGSLAPPVPRPLPVDSIHAPALLELPCTRSALPHLPLPPPPSDPTAPGTTPTLPQSPQPYTLPVLPLIQLLRDCRLAHDGPSEACQQSVTVSLGRNTCAAPST